MKSWWKRLGSCLLEERIQQRDQYRGKSEKHCLCGRSNNTGVQSTEAASRWGPNRGSNWLVWRQFPFAFCLLVNHLHIWSWCGHASLSQMSSSRCLLHPFILPLDWRPFSVHASGWEIHKNASSSRPNPPTGIRFEMSAGDQLHAQPGANVPPTSAWLVKGTSRAASWHDSWLPLEGSNLRRQRGHQDGSRSLLIT